MPYQTVINTNPQNPWVQVQFLNASGAVVNAPNGAQVSFTSDNENVLTIAPDPNNGLVGKITFPVEAQAASGKVKISVTGVNDVDGNAYSDQWFEVAVTPAIPAVEPSITFRVYQPPA